MHPSGDPVEFNRRDAPEEVRVDALERVIRSAAFKPGDRDAAQARR